MTPNRGDNVASPRQREPAPDLQRTGRRESQRQPERISKTQVRIAAAERRRIAEIESIKYQRTPRAPVIRNRRRR
jgi:hypothetical protein